MLRFLPAAVVITWILGALEPATFAANPVVQIPPLAKGLKNPESVVMDTDGRVLVSVLGEFNKPGDGAVMLLTPGKATPLATGLDDPKGLALVGHDVFAADNQQIWRINPAGKKTVFVAAEAFDPRPTMLNDLAADEAGNLYVSDMGDMKNRTGGVYRVSPAGKATLLVDNKRQPELRFPNGVLAQSGQLWVVDFESGDIGRMRLADGQWTTLARGFKGGDGLVRDLDGNLYVSQWAAGRVSVLTPGSSKPELLVEGFQSAADIGLDLQTGHLLIPDMKAGLVLTAALRSGVPRHVDSSPLAVRVEPAFANLEFNRPILLTHAGDETNRVFVASQLGRVFVFPNDQDVSQAEPFFDLHHKVRYSDKENEEGFLGMAFHPRFRENGEFFVYYTTTETPHECIISRFRATGPDHSKASADSEEVLMRVQHPFWNHKGGTLAFGPDGFLYVAVGDGGLADDPFGNGQNINAPLGKILRIDVDRKDPGRNYAIPKDNPLAGSPTARPEIFAYGLRNVWRLSFDSKTGDCWAADVGQNIWEEINLIRSGGNYGWNLREGMHRFRTSGSGPRRDLVEPIWEYHHDIGKSITGGHVYRGRQVPQLAGLYLYGDYVTGRIWGLQFDPKRGRVVANHPIEGNVMPIMSFGEDEQGEVYFMTTQGRLFRFASAEK